jgi:hypothetical protein
MIRVVFTAVVAFAVLVVGYHQFASASGHSTGGSPASIQPGTGGSGIAGLTDIGDAPDRLSASQARHLDVDQARWQADFDRFMRATFECPAQFAGVIGVPPNMGRCIAPAYRRWAASFARFQRVAARDMRAVSGSCRSALADSAGLAGAGTSLRASMRSLERDVARSRGPGVPTGLIPDTKRAVAGQAAMVNAALLVSGACA